jgi:hypothetical protein
MSESDIELILMVVSCAVIWAGAALVAVSLATQGPFWLANAGRRAVKVPPEERKLYFQTVVEAIALARAGRADEGYALLLSARRRLLTLAQGDEPWVEEVARWYQQALNRYVSRHGLG